MFGACSGRLQRPCFFAVSQSKALETSLFVIVAKAQDTRETRTASKAKGESDRPFDQTTRFASLTSTAGNTLRALRSHLRRCLAGERGVRPDQRFRQRFGTHGLRQEIVHPRIDRPELRPVERVAPGTLPARAISTERMFHGAPCFPLSRDEYPTSSRGGRRRCFSDSSPFRNAWFGVGNSFGRIRSNPIHHLTLQQYSQPSLSACSEHSAAEPILPPLSSGRRRGVGVRPGRVCGEPGVARLVA